MSTATPSLLRACRSSRPTKLYRTPSSTLLQPCLLSGRSHIQSLTYVQRQSKASFSSKAPLNQEVTTTALEDEVNPILRYLINIQEQKHLTSAENEERARLFLQQQEAYLDILKDRRTRAANPTAEAKAEYHRFKATRAAAWDRLTEQLKLALKRNSSEDYETIIADAKKRSQADYDRKQRRQKIMEPKIAHIPNPLRAKRHRLIEENRISRYLISKLRIKRTTRGQLSESDEALLTKLKQHLTESRAELQELAQRKPTTKKTDHSQRILTGRVTRTGTMRKTIRVTINTQTWNKKLQKHYSAQKHHLVHDPEELTIEGDVITIGPFTKEIHEQREKLGKIAKGKIQYMVKEVVTPFGKTVEQRREQKAIAQASEGQAAVEKGWVDAVGRATKKNKKGQGILAKGRQKQKPRIVA